MNTHDDDGNLTLETSPTSTIQRTFDYENRLTQHQKSVVQYQYVYDGGGLRTSRTIDGTITEHALDRATQLANVLVEFNTNGIPARYYIWGPSSFLLAQKESTGEIRYFHADEQGSTLAITDNSGSLIDEIVYDPYGKILARTSNIESPFLWLGGYGIYRETDTLVYMRNRYYETELKRFLSSDPLSIEGGYNLYEYAAGNPIWFIDPFGLEPQTGGGSFGSYIGDNLSGHAQAIQQIVGTAGYIIGSIARDFENVTDTLTGITSDERLGMAASTPVPFDDALALGVGALTKIGKLGKGLGSKNIGGMADEMAAWLGADAKTIVNKSSDKVFFVER